MIVTAILKLLGLIIEGLLSFLPTWTPIDIVTPVNDFLANADPIFSLFRWVDYYLPVSEAITTFGLVVTLWGAAVTWKTVQWVLTRLHILGGN